MLKKYVIFAFISVLAASVAWARLNSQDPNLRDGGAGAPSFADQFAQIVMVATTLNSGGAGTASLSPTTSDVSTQNQDLQLTGNTKPTNGQPVQDGSDADNTEI